MKVEVLPGHSVQTPGGIFFPGESLELDDAKAKRLIKGCFAKQAEATAAGSALKPNVAETVKLVEAASLEELDKLTEGETRKGVLDAIAKRRAELAPKE